MYRYLLPLVFMAGLAQAQNVQTRPGVMNDTQPIILPDTMPQQQPQTPSAPPAPQGPPPEFGGFKPLKIDPPGPEKLYAQRQTELFFNRENSVVNYITYAPGGPTRYVRDPIIIVAPEGVDLYGLVETIDLRSEARSNGRALLAVTVPQTSRAQSGEARDIARQALEGRNDGMTAGAIVQAVLDNEQLFARPSIVGAEGTGTIFQDYLCQSRTTSMTPAGIFLFDGGLRADTASRCDPPRMPLLAILQSADDQATPYAGGETAPVPGQPDGRVLSAPAARSFWALAARCNTEPDLKWIGLDRGRLAMQTHGRCSAGGPVVLLTLIDGRLSDEQKTILATTFLNGNLFE